ncbi:MAG: 50S ribosomal protein L11 methyltransferase, partial [Roseibacillus sp.]|nr:50S ribosomal protein L11 methyltransferase [Roseibacillus sp.]
MWVWLKYLADGQQDLWEQRVQGNQNAVITALRGRKSLRLELYCEAEAEALRLVEEFGGAVRRLEDLDWVAESARSIPPLKIRDSLLVTSETAPARLQELQKSNKDRIVVMIPAEMAFGTGDHATTSSCLRFLADEARARQGGHWSMLDLGCGSGVLAIAARLL